MSNGARRRAAGRRRSTVAAANWIGPQHEQPHQCRTAKMLEWKQLAAVAFAGLVASKCIPGTNTFWKQAARNELAAFKSIPCTNTCIKVGRREQLSAAGFHKRSPGLLREHLFLGGRKPQSILNINFVTGWPNPSP